MTADRSTGRPRLLSGGLLKAAWPAFLALGLAWAALWPAPPARAAGGYLAVACLRRNADLCGVINEKGGWVVEPGFDRISDFASNGRAVAVKRQRPGVINACGEWVIPPGFDLVDEEWSAGLIKVGRADRRAGLLYGLADEAGRLVVEPSFREIQAFGPNRLAGACGREGGCGFIDARGAWAVPPVFERVEAFSENGLAPARNPGEELWGYINAAGAYVIPPAYEAAFPFYGDRAKVFSEGLYSLINSKGQAVGRNKFATLGDFDPGPGGLAPAQKEADGLFGLVNLKGAWAVPPRFERVFSFNGDNLAPAQQDGLFGFINRKGQWVIKPSFSNVDDFESRGNRAPAQLSGAWGLIDSGGQWVVDPDHLLLLNTGVAHGPVQVFAENGRWGLMDENGRWLLEPVLTASPYFAANGLSEARVGNLYGFVNRFGKWVVEPSFQQVGAFRLVPEVPPVVQPKAEAEAEPRLVQARKEPMPTRFVVPDKASALSRAEADRAAGRDRSKDASEAPILSPPRGYIPPADPAPLRRVRPVRAAAARKTPSADPAAPEVESASPAGPAEASPPPETDLIVPAEPPSGAEAATDRPGEAEAPPGPSSQTGPEADREDF